MDLADYVLSRFPADEEDIIRSALKRTADALETWIEDGIDKAMNLFNKAVM